MITRHRKQSFLRGLWMPLLSLGILGYFGYHAFTGYYGVWSHERLEVDTVRLTAELDALKAERTALERRVVALRPDRLDADMVDLEARLALNRIRPDELIVQLGAAQQKPQ
ncbi:MAG: septum formation initiator family protein [Bauldia sp.]